MNAIFDLCVQKWMIFVFCLFVLKQQKPQNSQHACLCNDGCVLEFLCQTLCRRDLSYFVVVVVFSMSMTSLRFNDICPFDLCWSDAHIVVTNLFFVVSFYPIRFKLGILVAPID